MRRDAEACGIRGRAAAGGLRDLVAAVVALLAVVFATALGAQDLPPGSQRYDEGRFTFVAYPSEDRLARSLLAAALARDTFPGLPAMQAHVIVAIASNEAMFRRLIGAGAPEWGAAIAFPEQQRIVMQGRDAGADAGDPRVTLRHELAHLALHEAVGSDVPRWFDEGYASYAAGEWGREEIIATSVGLVWRGLPTLAGLDSGFRGGSESAQRAYALAHRAVAELAALDRERGLTLLFEYWRSQGSFERALRSAYGMSGADFERHWRSRVRRQYGALALAADLSVLSIFLVVLLGPLWWQRRARLRKRMERMREVDAALEARERESALAALLGEVVEEPPDDGRIKGS
ncbi:MAG: peptidase MA family metallohydrolase [Gemmatimonadaceae bacterium]